MVWLKAGLLVAAPLCLGLGLVLPLLRFETLYFFTRTPSLLDVIAQLWRNGDAVLASVVALFSVILPVVKLIAIMAEAIQLPAGDTVSGRFHRLLPHLARWSMMDVLLVAIVIVAAKSSGLASAFTQPGLWFYAVSAMLAGILPVVLRK